MAQILTTQPFPFTHLDIESLEYVPCGITSGRYVQGTPAEMMRLYWKVKSFAVSGSFTNYQFDDPNYPQSASYSGTVDSNATSELNLVCNVGDTSNLTQSGSINFAFLDLKWKGADFYFHSSACQPIVKLYGDLTFDTDQDDTSGITTSVGGSLSAFTIDDFYYYYPPIPPPPDPPLPPVKIVVPFQVYEAGSPVNYDSGGGLINNFTASIEAAEFWPYEA